MKLAFALLFVIVIHSLVRAQDSVVAQNDCKTQDLTNFGRPVMTRIGKELSLGVSIVRQEFRVGTKIEIHIWADNSSNTPADVWTCEDLEQFKEWGFDIIGQDGHRIPTQDELKSPGDCSTDAGRYKMSRLRMCLRNFPIGIPAHTCVTHNDFDFATELTSRYQLPPGEYTLRLRANWRDSTDLCKPQGSEPFHPQPNDLTFRVTKP